MMRSTGLLAIFVTLVAFGVSAQPMPRGETGLGASGLPLPRFVSLEAGEAYMRTGPGKQYPILWLYMRDGLPLEITAEYGNWRRVRDIDGTQGWMHAALLSGRRTALIVGEQRALYDRPQHSARVALQAQAGVVAEILACEEEWCRLSLAGRKAWIPRSHIWGTYAGETVK